MTKINENAAWEESIHQIQRGELVEGGPDGAANVQATQLANRTQYLKKAFGRVTESTGFQYIGQVASYIALKQVIPDYAGQHILLESYTDKTTVAGWASLAAAPRGGGQFVAVNAAGAEDGGSVAAVNDAWHWRRIIDGPYTPEMFGAKCNGVDDDVPYIRAAVHASVLAGHDRVEGLGVYTFKTPYAIPAVSHASPLLGGNTRQGLDLHLNAVIVDAASWPDVPVNWWDAQAAFTPSGAVEHLRLTIDSFDGGGKATCVSTKGGRISTSKIHIGTLENHIIGVCNFRDTSNGQSTMVDITGHKWDAGYVGVLNGGPLNGSGNFECWSIAVNWIAEQRYGAFSMQDRSQYAHIKAGTFDYNGEWMSCLYLTGMTRSGLYDIQFGDTVNIGSKTAVAMSNVMNCRGDDILLVAETSNKRDLDSDYETGAILTNSSGTFSATVSRIETTASIAAVRYFDVILSNVQAGFSRCLVTLTYGGGVYGANMFTNVIWCPNAVAGTNTLMMMGLEQGGSATVRYWYEREIFKNTPWLQMDSNGLTITQNIRTEHNRVSGPKADYDMKVGKEELILVLPAAPNITHPVLYEIFSVSSTSGQGGYCLVAASTTSLTILSKNEQYLTYRVDGLALYATLATSDGTLNSTSTKRV